MTWEQLKARQRQEWINHYKIGLQRRTQLFNDQKETLLHCHFIGPKGPDIIQRIFTKQREEWLQQEMDDRDKLRYAHEYEQEEFRKQCKTFSPERDR